MSYQAELTNALTVNTCRFVEKETYNYESKHAGTQAVPTLATLTPEMFDKDGRLLTRNGEPFGHMFNLASRGSAEWAKAAFAGRLLTCDEEKAFAVSTIQSAHDKLLVRMKCGQVTQRLNVVVCGVASIIDTRARERVVALNEIAATMPLQDLVETQAMIARKKADAVRSIARKCAWMLGNVYVSSSTAHLTTQVGNYVSEFLSERAAVVFGFDLTK